MKPNRGEIWLADLDPIRGREQSGKRPVLILSVDFFNHGPAGLVVVIPLTSQNKNQPLHVQIDPPEGGLSTQSWAKIEDIRSISTTRLLARWGQVSDATLVQVKERVMRLLGLP
jgi:mRNA interferase MazF